MPVWRVRQETFPEPPAESVLTALSSLTRTSPEPAPARTVPPTLMPRVRHAALEKHYVRPFFASRNQKYVYSMLPGITPSLSRSHCVHCCLPCWRSVCRWCLHRLPCWKIRRCRYNYAGIYFQSSGCNDITLLLGQGGALY